MSYQRTGESRLILGLPESLIDVLIPVCINVLFVLITALVLWLIGKSVLTFQLAKGFLIFWVVTVLTVVLLHGIQRLFRVSVEERAALFILSNALLGMVLIAGWTAFASLAIHSVSASATAFTILVLWLIALLSSVVAHVIVNTFHSGSIYALINLPVVAISLAIFGVWPALAQTCYGWFFKLFW